MSYTPTEWKTGDIVTSTKLNKLEQGVANAGALVVNVSVTDNGDETYTYTCDKTAGEMYEAAPNFAILFDDDGLKHVGQLLSFTHVDGYGYSFTVRGLVGLNTTSEFKTSTDSPSEYPTYLDTDPQ